MDNSVLNISENLSPRKLPGIYMIFCLANNYRYYGETQNISGRIASHKSRLRRKIHSNENLQTDWNLYGESLFNFVILYMGEDWIFKPTRLTMESQLINQNSERCYNIFESLELRVGSLNPFYQKRHSEKTKKLMSLAKKNIPNDNLGKKIKIEGQIFPSIAEASRYLGHSRKLIRKRINDKKFPGWIEIVDF
jgi:hypothetical protein